MILLFSQLLYPYKKAHADILLEQWLAELGGVFYSVKEKGYSHRERRVTELEFNRRMEIEAQIAADRERAAAEKEREKERDSQSRRKREVEVGGGGPGAIRSAVRRPVIGQRKIGGVVASSSSSGGGGGGSAGGSAVKKPQGPRRPGRVF